MGFRAGERLLDSSAERSEKHMLYLGNGRGGVKMRCNNRDRKERMACLVNFFFKDEVLSRLTVRSLEVNLTFGEGGLI